MTTVYNYDFQGLYTGSSILPVRPEGVGLPANCTLIAPAQAKENQSPRWNGSAWELVEDFRGCEGYVDGKNYTISAIGPLPAGWSNTPPQKSLEEVKKEKLAEIMAGYVAAFAPIEAIYPATEREGWPMQEAEANAVLVDSKTVTPVLSMLVQLRARGESVQDLARNVIEHAQSYRLLYAYLTGQQQRMYGEVSRLNDIEEILAYPVIYAMPEGL